MKIYDDVIVGDLWFGLPQSKILATPMPSRHTTLQIYVAASFVCCRMLMTNLAPSSLFHSVRNLQAEFQNINYLKAISLQKFSWNMCHHQAEVGFELLKA